MTGLEVMRSLMAAGKRPPIAEIMGFDLKEIDDGRAVVTATPGGHVYNLIGSVHGGYAATLLDSACGCAVHSKLPEGRTFTTLELKVSYHRAVTAPPTVLSPTRPTCGPRASCSPSASASHSPKPNCWTGRAGCAPRPPRLCW